MLKSLPVILLASTMNITDIDMAGNKEFLSDTSSAIIQQDDISSDESIAYEEPAFENISNEYIPEDLSNFSPEDLVESDILVYDENGHLYTGTIFISDYEGAGTISDENFHEQEINISFLSEGKLAINSIHPSSIKVEILNYRITPDSLVE